MSSPKSPFILTRATAADLPELIDLQYLCFPDPIRQIFMGCSSEADVPRYRQHFAEEMQHDPSGIYLVIRDVESKKIVAGAHWQVFMNRNAAEKGREVAMPWLQGEAAQAAHKVVDLMNETRLRLTSEGFVYLHICFTHPDYRRRGAGAMLLQWGCDLADLLQLPGYIEASRDGNFLYKTFGFEGVETMPLDDDPANDGLAMVREIKGKGIVGGK